ncbi:hypothetical protein Goshw_002114 [Gossypium schwendimanii]|uniref:Uncharacterized protein n=1 Tax=Gossypium schwendimanii TaxID=34291 RepID=A0A7J9L0D8_GOSSC|nr:hypothetical protein [Gossypium schwendimanii]
MSLLELWTYHVCYYNSNRDKHDDSAIAQERRVSTRFTDAELWGFLSAVGHGAETGSISPRTSLWTYHAYYYNSNRDKHDGSLIALKAGVLYQQSVTEPKPTPPVREHDMTESDPKEDLASFAICSEISEMYLAAFGHHEIPLSPRTKPGYYNLYAEKPLNVVIYIVETRLTPLEKSAKCCQLGAGGYFQ